MKTAVIKNDKSCIDFLYVPTHGGKSLKIVNTLVEWAL